MFLLVTAIAFFALLLRVDGYTDPFYLRLTTPKQENLILGTSRPAQGLQPQILKQVSGIDFYNYSFSVLHSPFGEVYYNSIRKKLKKGNAPGVFIVAVDPWSISSASSDPNNESEFRELPLCLGNTTNVEINPNFTYLFNNLSGRFYEILTKRDSSSFLHDDGWLEISVDMHQEVVQERIENKLNYYLTENLPVYRYSEVRKGYLKKTIIMLNNYGSVYLVRLPIHPRMMKVENKLMPDFTDKLADIIPLTKGYWDMTAYNSQFDYTDANHLYKQSGKEVTRMVAEWINENRDESARNFTIR